MNVELKILTGEAISEYLGDLAQLRLDIFRDYPYLYDGSVEEEQTYLKNYSAQDTNLCIVAIDANRVVGAATAMWLLDADEPFRKGFDHQFWDLKHIFYFAESVLLPDYRGRGIGKQFFDIREQYALQQGAKITAFCAVDRADDHPARPADYQSLHSFWQGRGYQHHPFLFAHYPWKEIGEEQESPKRLSYWIKEWDQESD